MFETLIVHAFSLLTGGAGGAILRLLPEGLKLIKQKMANGHELDMMDKQLQIQKEIGSQRLEEVQVQGATQVETERIKGAVETTKPIGMKVIDFANGITRPAVTWLYFDLYVASKVVMIVLAWPLGLAPLLPILWTVQDSATLSGILSFWFLGRVIDKQRNGD